MIQNYRKRPVHYLQSPFHFALEFSLPHFIAQWTAFSLLFTIRLFNLVQLEFFTVMRSDKILREIFTLKLIQIEFSFKIFGKTFASDIFFHLLCASCSNLVFPHEWTHAYLSLRCKRTFVFQNCCFHIGQSQAVKW